MPLSEDKIMAYVDGELDPAEDADVAAGLVDDPVAGDRAHALRELNGLLRAAYDDALKEPVPEALLRTVERRRDGVRGFRLDRLFEGFLAPAWAHAATAVLLIAIGGGAGAWLFRSEAETAGSQQLAAVLETERSGVPTRITVDGGQITPLLTFVHRDGRYCRQFEDLTHGTAAYGLACRSEGGAWQVEMMINADLWNDPAKEPSGPDYQLAGGPLDGLIDQALEAAMSEPPLAPEAERALISGGWK